MRRNYKVGIVAAMGRSIRLAMFALWMLFPGSPAAADTQGSLDELARQDIWTGLTINGVKVGFTHSSVRKLEDGSGRYEIVSNTSLLLRLLGFEKRIAFRSRDLVRADLGLEQFEAEYRMDGNALSIDGRVEDGKISLTLANAGQRIERELGFQGPLYPASAISFYPYLNGLETGNRFRFAVFINESQQIAEAMQEIGNFGRDDRLPGDGYRVVTRLQGQEGVLWIDRYGRPLLETALNGAMAARLEDAETAKRYLETAGELGRDVIVELSLVKSDRQVALPRRVVAMTVEFDGIGMELPSTLRQRCERRGQQVWRCRTDNRSREPARAAKGVHLGGSLTVPASAPAIVRLSMEITAAHTGVAAKSDAILAWIEGNIRKEAADGFSALDVLASRRGECQGHSYLYAALARAAGIPVRVVNGLVYSEEHGGFLYHTWVEALLEAEWHPLDPTFGQRNVDATHVVLVEGEDYADLAPLADMIGRVSARIADFEYGH